MYSETFELRKTVSFLSIEHFIVQLMHSYYSVALVRERTIPTERPPPVGEVSAKFCG